MQMHLCYFLLRHYNVFRKVCKRVSNLLMRMSNVIVTAREGDSDCNIQGKNEDWEVVMIVNSMWNDLREKKR